ncbi:hypothetical protein CSOJ01_10717 [Colletotrichum sojae]|uniref:Uncharacterized protein n=1 Tax=Colletotrichum sojae TaxID=2175907 RepID=A0A8H6J061_9PEZI|nr:hypothetical protein CSOJ01_10717 [Colletotrichum sojae]
MEAQRVNDELLKLILTKLHRLETRFNEIDSRINSIGFSMLPAAESSPPTTASPSRRCSCHIPQPVFQSFHVDWERHAATASAYKASVDKLRTRFEFDEESEFSPQDIGVASTCDGRSEVVDALVDSYSVSVYPSRPVSNFGFHVNNELRPGVNVPGLPALRYEDMPHPVEPPASTAYNSRRVSTISTTKSFSTRKSSNATTARNSIAMSSMSRTSSRSASFSKLRGSIRRATSMSVPRRKSQTSEDDKILMNSMADKETAELAAERIRATVTQRELESFVQLAQKGAKVCVSFVPNVFSSLARRMMNQQLKMLDVVA